MNIIAAKKAGTDLELANASLGCFEFGRRLCFHCLHHFHSLRWNVMHHERRLKKEGRIASCRGGEESYDKQSNYTSFFMCNFRGPWSYRLDLALCGTSPLLVMDRKKNFVWSWNTTHHHCSLDERVCWKYSTFFNKKEWVSGTSCLDKRYRNLGIQRFKNCLEMHPMRPL